MTTPIDHAPSVPDSGGYCAACGASLSVGARFCHRCGTPFGQGTPIDAPMLSSRSYSLPAVLPWGIAAVGLLVFMAGLASRESSTPSAPPDRGSQDAAPGPMNAPFAGGAAGTAPPDIANMTPSERAARLYVRVMEYAEAGKVDSVARFAPMVLAAHRMIAQPTVDERYHFGRVAEVVGSREIAKAQADTILQANPRSLLGLILAARAARVANDEATAKVFDKRLLSSVEAELATRNDDYTNHRVEIDRAVADARRPD